MPGVDVVRLGPFVGGLNTTNDPSSIADNELVALTNLELDIDASLASRPPIVAVTDPGTWTERIVVIGVGSFTSGDYIIGSNTNGIYYYFAGAWTLITATVQAACMVQYADVVWLIAGPTAANPGGQWDPVGGWVAQANLPKGEAAVVFKERLFVAPGKRATTNTSRLFFSEPANFLDYDSVTAGNQAYNVGTDFIDVTRGDGTKLVDVIIYRGNLLLFKEDSTFILAYETNPASAVVENISTIVGATQRHCVVPFEYSVFIYHEGAVFELINYTFTKINIKTKFIYDGGTPVGTTRAEDVFMCLFGERLFIRYFNNIYVYGLRTRVWSQWSSASAFLGNIGPLFPLPSNVSQSVNIEYFAGSSIQQHTKFYRIRNGFDSSTSENDGSAVPITCTIITKNYDLGASHLFKRLYWWGADILSNNSVTGTVTPIVFSFQTLWSDLKNNNVLWSQLLTWQNPLSSPSSVAVAVATGSGTQRRFLRFIKGLRYRQINFRLDLTTNGTTTDGPARIYTLSISTKVKQLVGKSVN